MSCGRGAEAGRQSGGGDPPHRRLGQGEHGQLILRPGVQVLRALLHGDPSGLEGEFYATRGVVLEPRSVQRPGPPIWIASWGSPAGLRRVARLGDGWLASAYNATPDRFREGLDRLADELRLVGRPPESCSNAIATTWLHITEGRGGAERTLADVLAPMLNRSAAALRSLPLPIGPAEVCAERLTAFVRAGARRIFVWPLVDEVRQLDDVSRQPALSCRATLRGIRQKRLRHLTCLMNAVACAWGGAMRWRLPREPCRSPYGHGRSTPAVRGRRLSGRVEDHKDYAI